MLGEAVAVCSKTALIENYRQLRRLARGAEIIAVVKANAYGHGLAPIATALSSAGASRFAVARLSEAIRLRTLLPNADILILGSTEARYAPLLARHRLIQSVHGVAYAAALSEVATEPIRAHLKLDCGMGRFGISLNKCGAMQEALATLSMPRLQFEAVFSHLPSADLPSAPETEAQRRAFRRFVEQLRSAGHPLPKHLSASAGILRFGADGDDLVRPGLALYGYPPSESISAEGFSPVLRLYAPVVAIRELAKGERLGYGGAFTAPASMRVALLGIGYGDGIPRSLSGATVFIGGRPCPIVGRICMDLTFAQLPPDVSVRVGELALLFGDGASTLFRLAAHADTVPYELLTSLSARLCREVTPERISHEEKRTTPSE